MDGFSITNTIIEWVIVFHDKHLQWYAACHPNRICTSSFRVVPDFDERRYLSLAMSSFLETWNSRRLCKFPFSVASPSNLHPRRLIFYLGFPGFPIVPTSIQVFVLYTLIRQPWGLIPSMLSIIWQLWHLNKGRGSTSDNTGLLQVSTLAVQVDDRFWARSITPKEDIFL
jgi:hypothetical protein